MYLLRETDGTMENSSLVKSNYNDFPFSPRTESTWTVMRTCERAGFYILLGQRTRSVKPHYTTVLDAAQEKHFWMLM